MENNNEILSKEVAVDSVDSQKNLVIVEGVPESYGRSEMDAVFSAFGDISSYVTRDEHNSVGICFAKPEAAKKACYYHFIQNLVRFFLLIVMRFLYVLPISFFLGATKHLYKRVCPSVRPSVGPSVRPLRLLIYPLIEVFRSTLCRVYGLVFIRTTFFGSAWFVLRFSAISASMFL